MNGRKFNHKYTEEEILSELLRMKEFLGRYPSVEDTKKYGQIGPKPMQTMFGSWENAKRAIGWIPEYEKIPIDDVTLEDGNWLAGLIDGEGCFRVARPTPSMTKRNIRSYAPVFCISLRDDDEDTLSELDRILGKHLEHRTDNRFTERKTMPNAKPVLKIFITDLPTLKFLLLPVLERCPLRSKKQRDLILFKVMVNILYQKKAAGDTNKGYTEAEYNALEGLYQALKAIKVYQSDLDTIIERYNLKPLFADDISFLTVGRHKPKGRPKRIPNSL